MKMQEEGKLRRRHAVGRILENRGDILVVTGLGSPTYDVAAVGDHANNFYLWGAMGSAVTVGLGLAMAQPARRVLVITGDGEMLMGLGTLATAGVKRPENLAVVVLDNEHYGETGMQRTHTNSGVDLAGIAKLARFQHTETVEDEAALEKVIPLLHKGRGPVMAVLKVSAEKDPLVLPSWDGPLIKSRFRQAVLGKTAA